MSDEEDKKNASKVALHVQIRTSLWTPLSEYLKALFDTAEVFNMHAIFAEAETALLEEYHSVCKDIAGLNHLPTGEEAAQYARGKQPDVEEQDDTQEEKASKDSDDDREILTAEEEKASEDQELFTAEMWDFWANHKHFFTKSVPFLKQMLHAFETQYSWSEGCLPHQQWYEGSDCEDQDILGVCALIDLAREAVLAKRARACATTQRLIAARKQRQKRRRPEE